MNNIIILLRAVSSEAGLLHLEATTGATGSQLESSGGSSSNSRCSRLALQTSPLKKWLETGKREKRAESTSSSY